MKTLMTLLLIAAPFFLPGQYAAALEPESVTEEQATGTPDTVMTEEASPSSAPAVEYIMPYPGMTPDHPLYFFKRLRDALMTILISDPVKKIEFSLLKSDKFMGMAVIMKEKGNWDLVRTVLTDSNKNYRDAAAGVKRMQDGGVVVPEAVIATLGNAAIKHSDILESMRQGADTAQDQMITAMQEELEAAAAGLTGVQ